MLLGVNHYEIHHVNGKWAKGTRGVRNDLAALESNSSLLTDNSVLLLFNFEGSTGFSKAMIDTFYDLHGFQPAGSMKNSLWKTSSLSPLSDSLLPATLPSP